MRPPFRRTEPGPDHPTQGPGRALFFLRRGRQAWRLRVVRTMDRSEALARLRRLEEAAATDGVAWFEDCEETSTEVLRLRTLVAWQDLEDADLLLINELIDTLDRPTVEGILDFIRAVEDRIRDRLEGEP